MARSSPLLRSQLVGPLLAYARATGADPATIIRDLRLPRTAEEDAEVILPLADLRALFAWLETVVAAGPFAASAASARVFRQTADQQINQVRKNGELVEKYFQKELAIVLGQEPADGVKRRIPLAKAIASLRAIGLRPQLTPQTDIRAGFFAIDDKVVRDFYAARKRRLDSREQDQLDTFMRDVGGISSVASQAQMNALMAHFLVIAHTGYVASIDRYFGTPPTDADVEVVRNAMMEERRAENVAAATTGIAALLVAILGAQKDPRAFDDVAQAFMSATEPVEVSAAEAKAFLDGFQDGLGNARARYEAQLEKSLGPEWKTLGIGTFFAESFALAEGAATRKTRADEQSLEAQKRAARARKTDPYAKTSAFAGARAAAATARVPLPSDERMDAAFATLDALKRGDAKAAANAAMSFVPDGLVKTGLGAVLKLL